MELTTVARVKQFVPVSTTQHDAALRSLIAAYSHQIERFLNRHVTQQARTEQYDVDPGVRRWWLRGYPVASTPAAQFRFDTSRAFTNSAEASDNYYLRLEDGRVEFEFDYNQTRRRFAGSLQVVYTGGMATTLDRLSVTVTNSGLVAGDTVTGQTLGGTGTVVSVSGTAMVLQVLTGTFQEGETIQDADTTPDSATLDSFTATPLVMSHPNVVEACNHQVAYVFQRRENLGLSGFSSEGGSITMDRLQGLITTTKMLLAPDRRLAESF